MCFSDCLHLPQTAFANYSKYLCIVKVSNRCSHSRVTHSVELTRLLCCMWLVCVCMSVCVSATATATVVRRKLLTFFQYNNRILWGNLSGKQATTKAKATIIKFAIVFPEGKARHPLDTLYMQYMHLGLKPILICFLFGLFLLSVFSLASS